MFFEMTKAGAAFFWTTVLYIITLAFCSCAVTEFVTDKTDQKLLRVFMTVESFAIWGLNLELVYEQWKAGYYAACIIYSVLLVIFPVVIFRWLILPMKKQKGEEKEKADENGEP